MTQMLSICREKTIKKAHSADQISADERKQFSNCLMKFMEAPMQIMSAMQEGQMQ